MSDNRLRIAFDYKKPDEATLVVYKIWGGSVYLGSEPSVSVVRTIVGKKLYSTVNCDEYAITIEMEEKDD